MNDYPSSLKRPLGGAAVFARFILHRPFLGKARQRLHLVFTWMHIMANDWIKVRRNLVTHEKVSALAKLIQASSPTLPDRRTYRDVTVTSLVTVWCAVNEQSCGGQGVKWDKEDIDVMVGIPGFAAMMVTVGWLIVDGDTLTFPNFLRFNSPLKGSAERTAAWRERQKCDGHSNVTSNVTIPDSDSDSDSVSSKKKKERQPKIPDATIKAIYQAYPRHVGITVACKAIRKALAGGGLTPEDLKARTEAYNASGEVQDKLRQGKDGIQFIPHPVTWFNSGRYMDESPAKPKAERKIRFGKWHCPKCRVNRDTTSAICSQCCGDLVRGWQT